MLQKPEDTSVDQFLKDVDSLKLKFPVVRIAEETGFNKSSISRYLNRKEEPSKNFLIAFYEWFNKSVVKVSHEKNELHVDHVAPKEYIQSLKNQVIELKEDKRFIKKQYEERLEALETNLDEVLSNQKVLMTMLTVAMTHAADFFSGGSKPKADELKRKMMTDIASAQEKIS